MAHSRTERIGTIFSRVSALLKGGGIQEDNLPLWYDIYKAFPPKNEPNFNRRPSQTEIPNILYKEDKIRVKFQKAIGRQAPVDLTNDETTQNQVFINLYNGLIKANINEEEAYSQALANYKSMFSTEENWGDVDAQASRSSKHRSRKATT